MKMTKKAINQIRANTPDELKGSGDYYTIEDYGYFMPRNANWSYRTESKHLL